LVCARRRPAHKDRLSDGQRAYNRLQAGLRALVEQAIGHLANAWSLRRWRGLLYRVRGVYRAAGALICLAGGSTEYPRENIVDFLNERSARADSPVGIDRPLLSALFGHGLLAPSIVVARPVCAGGVRCTPS
jgi:hypothetical protein